MDTKKIITTFNVLDGIVSEDKLRKLSLSGKSRIKLASNILALSAPANLYENARVELVKRLGTRDGATENYSVAKDSPNYPEFLSQHDEMLTVDHDVKLKTFSEDEIANSGLTSDKILQLMELGLIA